MTNTESASQLRRNLTVEDVFAAIRTLDNAAGADSGLFRWRLRQWMRHERELAEQQRAPAEIGRD